MAESSDQRREPRLTKKGKSYQLEIKLKEKRRIEQLLDKESDQVRKLIRLGDVDSVNELYKKWLNNYEQWLDNSEHLQALLDDDEEEKEVYETRKEAYMDMKGVIESFILTCMERRLTVNAMETRSVESSSSRSSSSSVVSHISIAKFKEEQKRAELLARAKALKEKQKIEEAKLSLRLKEEELNIKTELEVSEAKTKIMDEIDMSQTDSSSSSTISESRHGTPISKHDIVDKSGIHAVSRELNKPKAEITKFSGNPLGYVRFIRQFNARISENTDAYEEKINYLLQFTLGEAHRIALGYSNLPAERGFKATLEEYEERYDDSDVIAHAYVKRALKWPIVKQNDAKGLDDFAIFLRECQFVIEDIRAVKVLEYSDNLKLLVEKLPFYLHDKWRNIVYEIKSKEEVVKFEYLVAFIRKEAKKANDPVYGKETLSTEYNQNKQVPKLSAPKTMHNGVTRKNFATNASVTQNNSTLIKPRAQSLKPCLYCAEQHSLDT